VCVRARGMGACTQLDYLQRVKAERLARGGKGESDDDDEGNAPTFDAGPPQFTKGLVLRFTLGEQADKDSLRYETIKAAVEKFGKVQVRMRHLGTQFQF
jgi:hypothetical protein